MLKRKATHRDIPNITIKKLKMFQEINKEYLLSSNFVYDVRVCYKKLYSLGIAQHYIIEDNNLIVACAGGFIKDDLPYCFYKERKYGFIGDVFVEPQYRRNGYARTLTKAVINWLLDKDIIAIRLLASKNARNLYKSLGFKEADEMVFYINT